jgi:8-oxo-dGTP diphosphatase
MRETLNVPTRREFACAIVIDTNGRFLLQLRDDKPGILQPGKVGLFGGHRENGETFLQCVVREIHEEIGYFVSPDRFEHLASYDGVEFEAKGGTLRGEFFVTRNVPIDALMVTEGSLVVVEPNELITVERKLAPAARFAMKAYLAVSLPTETTIRGGPP